MVNAEKKLIQGNEACSIGALLAGLTFYAGYPITPSTEIAEYMAKVLPARGGVFIQMEDEIASIGALIGASLAGAKALTATSGPGFSLMQEGIGYACMTEVPCVIINVMRGGPSTGLPTQVSQSDVMQARWGTHGDHEIIVLCPNSVEECLHMTIRAFNLAEKYRTPVILLLDEVIGHMRENITIPAEGEIEVISRVHPTVPPEWYKHFEITPTGVSPMANLGEGVRYHVTGLSHDELGFPESRPNAIAAMMTKMHDKIENHRHDIMEIEEIMMEDANCAILAYGSVSRAAEKAVQLARKKRIKAGLVRLKTLWPFPDHLLEKALKEVEVILVPELNMGQMVREVERIRHSSSQRIYSLQRYDGELMNPTEILNRLREVR
ncbi:MAG: 2-oxoacid:acceptor oxidoreductase subunit alpha [Candidatus Delongbacteria bacterium]|nr:2-oxoacid:acceptor oxidoreductase subunit alpha [Candidatus Delongbacteria bacterium]